MMSSVLFRKILIAFMPVIFIGFSCSETIPEKQVNNAAAKVLKFKKTVPACCSKKPSRFSAKPKL
jgi:hypothetical protein